MRNRSSLLHEDLHGEIFLCWFKPMLHKKGEKCELKVPVSMLCACAWRHEKSPYMGFIVVSRGPSHVHELLCYHEFMRHVLQTGMMASSISTLASRLWC